MYSKRCLDRDLKWFKELYMDTTMIKNINGDDFLGRNPTDRGRPGNKISVIVDRHAVPVSMIFYKADKSDVSTIIDTVEGMQCPAVTDRRRICTIAADEAYVSAPIRELLMQKRIKLVTPVKRRMKRILPPSEKEVLKRRYKVENAFATLKQYRRVRCRYDRHMSHFAAFAFLAGAFMAERALARKIADFAPCPAVGGHTGLQ